MNRHLFVATLGYSIAAGLLAFFLAPLIPHVFGSSFDESARYVALLSAWIVPFSLRQYVSTRLATSGSQVARVGIEAAGFCLLVLTNLALMPRLGVEAAIVALLVTEVSMLVACALVLHRRSSFLHGP